MPTQRAICLGSVNEYQWKLGSKRAYHAMVLWLRLVSGWGLRKQRSVPPQGPLRLGKGLYFLEYKHRC